MKTTVQEFLTELYEIDPSLREHEATLIPLLEKLLKHDPAQKPNEAFVSELRMQLKEYAANYVAKPSFDWSRLIFALGGAATVLVAAVIFASPVQQMMQGGKGSPMFSYSVEEVGPDGFGSLKDLGGTSPVASPAGPALGSPEAISAERMDTQVREEAPVTNTATEPPAMARSMADDVGTASKSMPSESEDLPLQQTITTPAARPQSGGGGGGVDAKMIAPYQPMNVKYVFHGELSGLQEEVTVYKHVYSQKNFPFAGIASRFNISNVDTTSFGNMNVDSITLSQKEPFGHQLYLDLVNGSLGINMQWDQWPMSKCTTEACYAAERVTIDMIPSDDVLKNIARTFLTDHGIDLSEYGQETVDNVWRVQYDAMPDKQGAYVPDNIRVVFPFLIEGKPTHDQSGNPMGISVGVSVKEKKVTDVWGIQDRTYQKSTYKGVVDAEAIKKYIDNLTNNFGFYPASNVRDAGQPETTSLEVTLSTPTTSYAMYSRFSNNKSEELLIPVLIFPVETVKGSTEGFWQQQVVVPLAKEILEEQGSMPRPMPLDDVKVY